jgi:hypothetical protein
VAVDQLFGFLGLIVAVPILATIKILVEELWIKPVEQRDHAFTGELMSSPREALSVAGGQAQRQAESD